MSWIIKLAVMMGTVLRTIMNTNTEIAGLRGDLDETGLSKNPGMSLVFHFLVSLYVLLYFCFTLGSSVEVFPWSGKDNNNTYPH